MRAVQTGAKFGRGRPRDSDICSARSDNANPSGVFFFTLFLRSFILLRELECVVGTSVVGSGAKGDQRCARGFAVLQYTRKHGLVRERRVCVTSGTSHGTLRYEMSIERP